MIGLGLPRESQVRGVAATRLTAVPRDNGVTWQSQASHPRAPSPLRDESWRGMRIGARPYGVSASMTETPVELLGIDSESDPSAVTE